MAAARESGESDSGAVVGYSDQVVGQHLDPAWLANDVNGTAAEAECASHQPAHEPVIRVAIHLALSHLTQALVLLRLREALHALEEGTLCGDGGFGGHVD
jgi:hypothetical protein